MGTHVKPRAKAGGSSQRPVRAGRRVTIRRLSGALFASAAAGLVIALLAAPFVGLVGISAKSGADEFLALPENLTVGPLVEPSTILDARGNVIATLVGDQYREVVPLSQVPQVMRNAIIDIEDARFYQHSGVDYKGMIRAYVANRNNGSVTQGASTITQQYVKNVLLQEATTPEERKAATAQTVDRKLREARYALYLDQHLPKDKILEGYLNIAYFGDGAYGIQAAAKRYFNVDVSQLTLPQAATLAGLVKNPTAYDPIQHPQSAQDRRGLVLDAMQSHGHISVTDLVAAKAAPLGLNLRPHSADSCADSTTPFFCAQVRQMLLADRAFAPSSEAASKLLFDGGLTIHTTLDPVAQAAADSSARTIVPPGNRVAAGVAMVQPGTGAVLAMTENRDYGATDDGQPPPTTTDFVHTKEVYPTKETSFSPGSTFKMFALASALEQGLPLSTTFMSPACYHSDQFPNPKPNDCYANADPSEAGPYSLTTATWNSVNTYYVQLEQKVGVLKIAEMARRLGVSSCRVQPQTTNLQTNSPCHKIDGVGSVDGSFVIGSNEISTLDLATAYATIAAHGERCDPVFITSITQQIGGADRLVNYTKPGSCEQVLNPTVADTVTSVLEGVISHGTATGNGQIGRPAAGKTGTAEDFTTASFVGFVPQLATAVTLADPRGPQSYPLRNVLGYAHVYGGDLPTKIWSSTMRQTLDGLKLPVEALPPPDNTQPVLPNVVVPNVVGALAPAAVAFLQSQGFSTQVRGNPNSVVLLQYPSAGSQVPAGQTIALVTPGGSIAGLAALDPGGTQTQGQDQNPTPTPTAGTGTGRRGGRPPTAASG
ncbi:penicillin-binding protein [Frankia sp. AgB1.9]|uniref:transglycosylase domain-containing protein n=1 Tax=unclassified Frankia TaxID=2632575 RepID=UPI0019335819|nr:MULTISPECIES: transglycosylase domain-containing protein [unclassified Frankia]MBL7492122.1 penicillin-binding protein [Frankia sp. AgW1.1]MBL7551719.1 penicillin-binding protein [Frankia sp. AgB1.9]MBL7623525.1 penicillin-binding protein [Frankia sp. AgB1.8]